MSAPVLSRAVLRLRPARGWTVDYITHQLVADLFGEREGRGYLFRVTRRRPGGVEALVLSDVPPLLPERLPVRDWGVALDVQSKDFAPALAAGQLLDFEIRVNATRVVTDAASGKKHRSDVWEAVWRADKNTGQTQHDVYAGYLARKVEGAAEIETARATERGEVRARRGDRRTDIRFVATNLIGTLRVIEPAMLLDRMRAGIGREKAFGCGLLCLSRPGTVLPRAYPDAARELY